MSTNIPGPDIGPVAHPWVRNAVLAVGWLWVFLLLFAVPVAVYVVLYNIYQRGVVPDLSGLASALPPSMTALAAGGAAVAFVLLLSNATFGSEVTDATVDQAEEAYNQAEDEDKE